MKILSKRLRDIKTRPDSGKIYYTYKDLQDLPEWPEGPLLEIIEGELFLVPSPTTRHQEISGEIDFIIRAFLKSNPIGRIYSAPIDVILSEEDVVVPDLLIILNENREVIKTKNIQGAPDLIIEILSTDRKRDLVYKKALYSKYNVKEYWVVDSEKNTLIIHTNARKKQSNEYDYCDSKIYKLKDRVSTETIPGLRIDLTQIFKQE